MKSILSLLIVEFFCLCQLTSIGKDSASIKYIVVKSHQFDSRVERPVSSEKMKILPESIVATDTIHDIDILASISPRLCHLDKRSTVKNIENIRMLCYVLYSDKSIDTVIVGVEYMEWHGVRYSIDTALLWLLSVGLPVKHQNAIASEIEFLNEDR